MAMNKKKKMISILNIIIMLAVLYVIACVLGYFAQPFITYFPSRKIFSTPAALALNYEQLNFVASDGVRISGWFVPADKAQFTVIYCHGNGGNLSYYLDVAAFLNRLNLNCLLFDYRGYGESEGKPTENGTYLDAEAAYKWLVNEKKITPSQIIIYGWSLGAAVAANLATKVDCAGLALDGAFTSYSDIAQKHFFFLPVRLFAKYNYRTIDYIKDINCPVMLSHSRDDETSSFRFGEKLFEAANEPKRFFETSGRHNDAFLQSREIYENNWLEWLKFLRTENASEDYT